MNEQSFSHRAEGEPPGPPRLTLIVPVYNVAAFLPRCLESLATEPGQQTEIIFVDDGSTDDCPSLLAAWAGERPHARVIRQENGGLSAARNTGLRHARGRFVAFVDSDDYYDAGYYGRLADLCEAHRLDLAIGNSTYHFEGRLTDFPIYSDRPPAGVLSGTEFLRHRLLDRSLLHMVWMHVYRREWLERHGLRFVPGLIHEDVPWTTQALLLAERVTYDPNPGYHYRQRVRRFSPEENDRRLRAIIASSVHNAQTLARLADGIRGDPELQRLVRWQLVDGGLSIFHKLRQLSSREVRRQVQRQLLLDQVHGLLWQNATEWRQRRRILRNYLGARMAFA